MLGVMELHDCDRHRARSSEQVAGRWAPGTAPVARVGVFFGPGGRKQPGTEVADPFFGGAGPPRRGCLETGECMTGCRHNAKNTLVKNYLYLAEQACATRAPALRRSPCGRS